MEKKIIRRDAGLKLKVALEALKGEQTLSRDLALFLKVMQLSIHAIHSVV